MMENQRPPSRRGSRICPDYPNTHPVRGGLGFTAKRIPTVIVALAGPEGCGKSTVAQILHQHHGFVVGRFSQVLRQAAKLIWELSEDQVNGGSKDEVDPRYNLTPRFIMQRFGAEVCRSVYPDTWTEALRRWIEGAPAGTRIVVDDLRFINEVRMLRSLGAKLVEVHRPFYLYNPEHESSKGLPHASFDFDVHNTGDLEMLEERVRDFVLTDLGLEER